MGMVVGDTIHMLVELRINPAHKTYKPIAPLSVLGWGMRINFNNRSDVDGFV